MRWLLLLALVSTPAVAVEYSRSIGTGTHLSRATPQFDWARAVLPIRTPEMEPGVVARRVESRPEITRPLFLVGADPRSLQWLRRHRERLRSLRATGLLVAVRSLSDLDAVAAVAQGLPISPASASSLARRYGLTHYPLLLSSKGIEQ